MKIYFCDVCNESIPLTDLQAGRAVTAKGKMFCPACLPPPSPPIVAAPPAPASSAPTVLAAISLVVAVGAMAFAFVLSQRLHDVPRYDSELGELTASVSEVSGRLSELRGGQDRLAGEMSKVREDQMSFRQSVADQGHSIETNQKAIEELRTLLQNLRSNRELIQRLEIGRGELEHSLETVRESVAALERRIDNFTLGDMMAGEVEEPEEDPEDVELSSDVRRLVADLDDVDASIRWAAVDQLASRREVSLVPYLVPLLQDSDPFVQFRVISALRELNARGAVGRLIELLRDGDAIVREEALEALVSLTGHAARFDVTNGSPSEREKGIRSWETWYESNRDRFDDSAS